MACEIGEAAPGAHTPGRHHPFIPERIRTSDLPFSQTDALATELRGQFKYYSAAVRRRLTHLAVRKLSVTIRNALIS